jgi:hypothetical protein
MKVPFVAVALFGLTTVLANAQNPPNKTRFTLHVNPPFANCLGESGESPQAVVNVTRGKLADVLSILVTGLKPNLLFDLFTVQRSNLDANGKPVAGFTNFGLAWYQTDLQANGDGVAKAAIQTILLDQIFGFDPDVNLAPTNTFHVGFWFNDPKDAQACGFDVTKPTPFNGEHKAGPVAMISVPNAETNLGPLCVNPNGSGGCNP